jgi:hypothetical protein
MASLFLETSQLGLSEGAATVLAAKGGEGVRLNPLHLLLNKLLPTPLIFAVWMVS